MTKITRALISVSDKTGIEALARALVARSVTILSTGGTARVLRDAGIEVTEVSDVTGFPEIMDGRVKTLHPRIHGGLLGRRGTDDGVMEEHGIPAIDLLVVNLYPFEETVADPDCSRQRAVENIDVGGPAMLRAAAKNHDHVTVLVDPDDYQDLIEELDASDGSPSQASRERLAAKAFAHTAAYDAAIAAYLREDDDDREMPARLVLTGARVMDLRYGENPHQEAALYRLGAARRGTVIGSEQIQGKPLSYNNLADAEAALETVRQFEAPACVVVKHANPCGVAVGDDPAAAYRRAFASDPVSAFGGIIAFNRPLEAAAAHEILDRQFVEVVVAPEFASDAVEAFQVKPNVRVLACGPLHGEDEAATAREFEYKRLRGGLLVQEADAGTIGLDELEVVTREAPDQAQLKDLMFAWKVAKFVKSNAVVYARVGQTLGIGAGQMSRVDSARIALLKAQDAGLSVQGSAMASDAFFPFRDSVDSAAEAGVAAIIQPGGSIRDKEVIAAADEHGIAMVFTGMRHFRH